MNNDFEIIDLTKKLDLEADFVLVRNFLDNPTALMNNIINNADFSQFFSHTNKPVPRLLDHYGHEYSYYHSHHPEKEIPIWLHDVKNNVEHLCGQEFNGILLNFYPDQKSNISWHSDNEDCLGKNPTIVSLSLGETRTFCIRHKKSLKTYSFDLLDNDLLIMGDQSQINYVHSVPAHPTKCKPRINITLRYIY